MTHVLDVLGDDVARAMSALSSPTRFVLLMVAAQAPRSIEALAEQTGLSPALVSHHLKVLRAAGLLHASKHGREVRHTLPPEAARLVAAVVEFTWSASPHLREAAEAYSSEALTEAPADALIIDVRAPEEHAWAHLPGSVSVPLAELMTWMPPENQAVVCHGRGRFCPLAERAVQVLRARGVDARRLAAGVVDWAAARVRVEGDVEGLE